jgi:hypothetical protein
VGPGAYDPIAVQRRAPAAVIAPPSSIASANERSIWSVDSGAGSARIGPGAYDVDAADAALRRKVPSVVIAPESSAERRKLQLEIDSVADDQQQQQQQQQLPPADLNIGFVRPRSRSAFIRPESPSRDRERGGDVAAPPVGAYDVDFSVVELRAPGVPSFAAELAAAERTAALRAKAEANRIASGFARDDRVKLDWIGPQEPRDWGAAGPQGTAKVAVAYVPPPTLPPLAAMHREERERLEAGRDFTAAQLHAEWDADAMRDSVRMDLQRGRDRVVALARGVTKVVEFGDAAAAAGGSDPLGPGAYDPQLPEPHIPGPDLQRGVGRANVAGPHGEAPAAVQQARAAAELEGQALVLDAEAARRALEPAARAFSFARARTERSAKLADADDREGDVLLLEPDDGITRPAPKGHRYVAFDKQPGRVEPRRDEDGDALDLDVRRALVDPRPRGAVFDRVSRHGASGGADRERDREGDGDVLILEPRDDALRPRARAPVDMRRQLARRDESKTRDEYGDELDLDPADALDRLRRRAPAPVDMRRQLDRGAAAAAADGGASRAGGQELILEPNLEVGRRATPMLVDMRRQRDRWQAETKGDGGGDGKDGDRLALEPDDAWLRPRACSPVDMSRQAGPRLVQPRAEDRPLILDVAAARGAVLPRRAAPVDMSKQLGRVALGPRRAEGEGDELRLFEGGGGK